MNAIIRGDTDPVSSFSDVAHNASLNIGIVAIQNELTRLIAKRLIPKERNTSGSITFATNTRTYDLATDFVRFYGVPHFYNVAQNRQIYEYAGGLPKIQVEIFNYDTQYGQPNWWYWEPVDSTNKKVGFFLVPSSTENGQVWTYDYEQSVMVTVAADSLPFHNDEESFTFSEMAARRFKFMYEDVKNAADIQAVLDADTSYRSATATLYSLLKGENAKNWYGSVYR
jgi:hypothetical protein